VDLSSVPDNGFYTMLQQWHMTPEQRNSVLAALNGPSMLKANDAAQAIWADPDPALRPAVISVLRNGRRVYNRVEAAYALRMLKGDARTIALERALSNKNESPRVRAFAAEALADGHRSASHSVLLRNLKDPAKEVRFWCAFALGQIGERKALPALKWLSEHDNRVLKGWWAVSKEARDAIAEIHRNRRRPCLCRR
jgi:HEAT repeat protein